MCLQIELPKKVEKDFKDSEDFNDAADDFILDKILKLYDILSGQL